jgi:hypothetical protein
LVEGGYYLGLQESRYLGSPTRGTDALEQAVRLGRLSNVAYLLDLDVPTTKQGVTVDQWRYHLNASAYDEIQHLMLQRQGRPGWKLRS